MGQHADDLVDQLIRKELEFDPFLHKPTQKRPTWTTLQGTKLYIDEMTIDHIQNCVNMLRQKGKKAPALMYKRLDNANRY